MYWINKRLTLVAAVSALSGCGSIGSLTTPMLETDGERMVDIYRHALQEGETVDKKVAASEAGEPNDSSTERSTVDPAYLAEHGSKDHRYKHKAYTELNGRYYSKKTGLEIGGFQCGAGTRVVSKPCSASYGFGTMAKRTVARRVKEDEKKLADDLAKAPAKKPVIEIDAAEVERLAVAEIERRRALAVAGNDREPDTTLATASPVNAEVVAPPCASDDLYCGFSRSSDNELQQLFPRLENPDIVVYITPHLATHNNVPVPGYTTAFPLYDEVHYALPGERVDP